MFLHNISVGYIDRIGAINITMFPSLFIDNTNEGGDSICGSVVSSDFMGCPRNYRMLVNGDGVYYGFNLKDNDELIAVGNSSLSDIANKRFSGDKNLNDYYLYAMFAPNDLPINITDYYGEGRIYRKCQGEKRKPDYILCFDEINNDAVRHAEYYNIPIYFINRVGLLKKQVAKILNEFEQLKSCDNISLNQVEKYFNRLSSFSYELMYCEYFLDYSDNEIQELIGVLKELYAASSEFIDKHLRRLIKNSNKVERITINNLTNKNSRTAIAIDDLSKRLHMSSKLNNFESIGNISVGDTRSLIDDLKGMLDREKDL